MTRKKILYRRRLQQILLGAALPKSDKKFAVLFGRALPALASAFLIVGCDQPAEETVVPPGATTMASDAKPAPAAVPAERPTTIYNAVGPEAEAWGLLSIILPPGGVGGGRTFSFGNGYALDSELVGVADITKPIGAASMHDALGVTETALQNGGDPRTYLLKVLSENAPAGGAKACGDAPVAYILSRQLDTPTDRTATLLLLTAAPGEDGATACKKLVYTAR